MLGHANLVKLVHNDYALLQLLIIKYTHFLFIWCISQSVGLSHVLLMLWKKVWSFKMKGFSFLENYDLLEARSIKNQIKQKSGQNNSLHKYASYTLYLMGYALQTACTFSFNFSLTNSCVKDGIKPWKMDISGMP